ncbi:MAG TPA: twin-arginine translocase TatA/TatE family subunit [Hanamia sp.]|nr:twin-arginine translocase TatA/TatE family subunit [Hanamia sp.]
MINFFNLELLFAMPGGTEWVLILVVILLFFGGRKIPELMRGIGRGVKEFNDGKENVKKEIDNDLNKKGKS